MYFNIDFKIIPFVGSFLGESEQKLIHSAPFIKFKVKLIFFRRCGYFKYNKLKTDVFILS